MDEKRIMGSIKQQFSLPILIIVTVGILIGIGISETNFMFYNILFMPGIGALGYFALRKKSYWLPLAVLPLTYLWFMFKALLTREGGQPALFLSLLYAGLFTCGIVVTLLCKYAFTKTGRADALKPDLGLRIIAATVAVGIMGTLLLFTNGFVGNPLSRILAKESARQHIATNHPDLDLNLSKAAYDFKYSGYHIEARSPTSIDTHFTLSFTAGGNFRTSDYNYRVAEKNNTLARINGEYRSLVNTALDTDDFPYTIDICRAQILRYYEDKEFGPKYGIDQTQLVLDKRYDVATLGETSGSIVLYVENEMITVAKAAAVLLAVKDTINSKQLGFYAIDFVLKKPRADRTFSADDKRIEVREFLAADIYEIGLEERVAAAQETLIQYYAKRDAKRDD